MTTDKKEQVTSEAPKRSLLRRFLWAVVRFTLAILIIGAAVMVYRYQMKTSPRAQRKPPAKQARLVKVVSVQRDDCVTKVSGNIMGPVMPAREVTLQPQVSGRIVSISEEVMPGCFVQAGQKLLSIDDRDYEIIFQQKNSEVVKMERDLKVEQGNQAVAKQEYDLLEEIIEDGDRELVLREPQLASAKAALEAARAALHKAKLDLDRCQIEAPFNAIVQEKHVDVGATVGTNSALVTLIGTDQAWIVLKVPVNKLRWITVPEKNGDTGSNVTVFSKIWGPDRFRIGHVLRLYGELEQQGRLAQLLVVVDDPFCLKPENHGKPELLMGSLVSAEIEGHTLPQVFPVERSYVRDDDTLWIMNDANELEIRPVEIVYRGVDRIYITKGLSEGERLVLTDIGAPVEGMPLRVADDQDEIAESAPVVSGKSEGRS